VENDDTTDFIFPGDDLAMERVYKSSEDINRDSFLLDKTNL
jgi:hypothetical protein